MPADPKPNITCSSLLEIEIPTGVRTMVLDAHGTLMEPVEPVAATYLRVGTDSGYAGSRAEVSGRIRSAFAQADWDDASQQGQTRTWRSIVEQVFHDLVPSRREQVFRRLWDHYQQPGAWRLFPEVARVLPDWKATGLELVIGSNFDDRLQTVIDGFPEFTTCQHVFWSSQLGFSKPDRRFFLSIQSRLGREAHECVMIGDSLYHDIRGARGAGWHAIHVDRPEIRTMRQE